MKPPQTLVAWIAAVARAQRERPAVFHEHGCWTYRELWERAGGLARHLRHERKLDIGTRIALIGENQAEYLAAYLGTLRAGCVAVPLNPMLDLRALGEQLDLVRAAAIIIGEVSPGVSDGLRALLPALRLSQLPMLATGRLPTLHTRTPACILLTSGSTGMPKGVVHSQGTLLHAALELASFFPFSVEDRSIAFLPFCASIPEQILPTLCSGGSLDVLPRFDPERVARAARRATTFDAVPTVMARLLADAPASDLSQLSWVMFASEPMPVSLLERWWDAVPGVETHQLYGMTEVLPMAAASDRLLREQPATVGRALPTSRLSARDDTDREHSDGGAGEIICLSPAAMLGYFENDEATVAATAPGGGIRTGDLGRFDERGRLFLTGRIKDLIISGGLNIAPAEIEAVACRHPGVIAAAVVGIPDARWGETPVVVAVPVPGNGVGAADVLQHCREQLTAFKRPSGAAIVNKLPLTGIGKSAKSLIRQQILEGTIELVRAD